MSSSSLPTVGTRTTLDGELRAFLPNNTELHLGGSGDFHDERAHHTKVFGFHSLPSSKQAPIQGTEFTAIRGVCNFPEHFISPFGTIRGAFDVSGASTH